MKQAVREKIIQAAIIQFARFGYENISLREIAFDLGIELSKLKEDFLTKEEVMDAILKYIPMNFQYYKPTRADIQEQLKNQSPTDILNHVIAFYNWENDSLIGWVYRLMYMEQFKDNRINRTAYNYLIRRPIMSIKQTLDLLVEMEKIPVCDTRAMAELLGRTALMFGMMITHDNHTLEYSEYKKLIQYLIQVAVRGVPVISKEQIHMRWATQAFWEGFKKYEADEKYSILLTALDLFSKHGYKNVPLSSIAQERNIDISEIYKYYDNKADIMQDITAGIFHDYDQYMVSNPGFDAQLEGRDPVKIILTFSGSYPPLKDNMVLKFYRLIFREQYYNEEFKDFFIGAIYRDIDSIMRKLGYLMNHKIIMPCDVGKISTSYVYTMCSLTIGATLFPEQMEELNDMRVRTVAILISLIIYGYCN